MGSTPAPAERRNEFARVVLMGRPQRSVQKMGRSPRSRTRQPSRAAKRTTRAAAAAVKSTSRVAQETAAEGEQIAHIAAELNDRAARVGVEAVQQSAENVQRVLQSGTELAAQVAMQSADQLSRAFGFTGHTARKAAEDSSGNVNAVFKSGTVLAEVTTSMAREWLNFAHERMETNLARVQRLVSCRTPQEFAAFQSEILRDNIEGMVECTRKIASHSARVAGAAQRGRDSASP